MFDEYDDDKEEQGFPTNPSGNPTNAKVLGLYDKAESGNLENVKTYLATQKMYIDHRDCNGFTALMLAAEYNNVKALKTLIAAGANVNVKRSSRNPCMTPIMIATEQKYTKCLQALVDGGARLNEHRYDGLTLLMIAAKSRHLEGVEILVKAGADVNEVSNYDQTPLMLAARSGYEDMVHTLIQHGANVNMSTRDGTTALMLTSSASSMWYTEKLPEYVRTLALAGANVNVKSNDGSTALIFKAQRAWDKIHISETLLQAGANPNIQNNSGKTALMYAAERSNETVCKFLIQNSALVNVQDNHGKTPLMYSVESGRENVCKFLIQNSADLNEQDKDGKTALMYVTDIRCLELLLSAGADTEIIDNLQCTALVYFLRKKNGQFSDTDCATCILKYGANPVLDPCHRSILTPENFKTSDYSLNRNYVELSLNLQILRLMVCNGVVVEKPYSRVGCNTSFAAAVYNRNIALVKYFIATCYLTNSDVENVRKIKTGNHFRRMSRGVVCFRNYGRFEEHDDIRDSSETEFLLQEAASQPWPLVKLAFIAVSSALGASPERENRIKETQLPPRLQHMLMFQEPVSCLPVSEWADIPLCFDPTEYEKLPKPRPLIYYWPFGRDLII